MRAPKSDSCTLFACRSILPLQTLADRVRTVPSLLNNNVAPPRTGSSEAATLPGCEFVFWVWITSVTISKFN